MTSATEIMVEKVNKSLEKWIGGEAFFTEVDRQVKMDKDLISTFMSWVKTFSINRGRSAGDNVRIIASGELGLRLHNYGYFIDVIVEGGLRKGHMITDLKDFIEENTTYIFIDDSYFSGRTAEVIRREVEKYGGKLSDIIVFYDGSFEKKKNVHSLYRYYNHFDILGNKIK